MSLRICAWMVTSSAVVGSSAMMSFGLHESAIAIITRWRMPPENWCGYCPSRRSASGMPTIFSSSSARARAWASLMLRWISSGSMIWKPMVSTGFNEVIGSWKIIAMSRPRISRISPSDNSRRLRPWNRMRPATTRPAGRASSRMMASEDTDLPQPDSPTSATTSPGRTL